MKRREFITILGGAAAWPRVVYAQQTAMPVVGYLSAGSPAGAASDLRAFQQGLSETGYVEGRNVAVEYRWADGQLDRLPALAADLARRKVSVIATGNEFAVRAVKAASNAIPIVFGIAGDPVQAGLVASLNRPGGNITGVATLSAELMPKKLELLHEVVPMATTIAVLVNPKVSPDPPRDLQAAAAAIGLQLQVTYASSERDLDVAFANLGQQRASALVIAPNALFLDRRELLGALALRHAIPAIHTYREFTQAGGLMSYGGDRGDSNRVVGVYVGRILKGEKPADLPVQQTTKVELIINLKTAKALGLIVPASLLTRADEVIE